MCRSQTLIPRLTFVLIAVGGVWQSASSVERELQPVPIANSSAQRTPVSSGVSGSIRHGVEEAAEAPNFAETRPGRCSSADYLHPNPTRRSHRSDPGTGQSECFHQRSGAPSSA